MNHYQISNMQLQIKILALLSDPKVQAIIILLIVWDLIWRGAAMWKASKSDNMGWFIALLILNTLGILPIIYIYYFSQNKSASKGVQKK